MSTEKSDGGAVNPEWHLELMAMEARLFEFAREHGVKLKLEIRWPDGLRTSKRSLNDRELAANAKHAERAKEKP